MTDIHEEHDEFYEGSLGWVAPTSGPSKGYGKPPVQYQFKKGQSGNISGRPRRRRRAEPPGDLMAAVMQELGQRQSIKIGDKIIKASQAEIIAKLLVRDMTKDTKSRLNAINLLDKMGVFHAADTLEELRHSHETADNSLWTEEMERRFREIEAEFFENIEPEPEARDEESRAEAPRRQRRG